VQSAVPPPSSRWQKYVTPLLVVVLALAVLITVTGNWNSWEGGKVEQVTDDAYVRGDLTPLSTKIAGIVRAVHVSDYQQCTKETCWSSSSTVRSHPDDASHSSPQAERDQ